MFSSSQSFRVHRELCEDLFFFSVSSVRNFKFFVFLYVLLFFVIPPVFTQFFVERNDEFVASYPFSTFLLGGIAFLIYISALKG